MRRMGKRVTIMGGSQRPFIRSQVILPRSTAATLSKLQDHGDSAALAIQNEVMQDLRIYTYTPGTYIIILHSIVCSIHNIYIHIRIHTHHAYIYIYPYMHACTHAYIHYLLYITLHYITFTFAFAFTLHYITLHYNTCIYIYITIIIIIEGSWRSQQTFISFKLPLMECTQSKLAFNFSLHDCVVCKKMIHTLVETLLKGEEGGKRFCVLWLLWSRGDGGGWR